MSNVPLVIGRYVLLDKIGAGGMASVFLGRMTGAAGLCRTVAIKRLHPHLAEDRELLTMLLDEARITMRIRHPNVVPTIDVVQLDRELLIVMEYVVGVTLERVLRQAAQRSEAPPPPVAATLLAGVLHGLHAAHEVQDERGRPLDVVHRDVSPQNILVGADGVTRVLDFGIAKAVGRMLQSTQSGQAKGKLAYMAPEQLEGGAVDRRTDVFAAGIVLWETLTLARLFSAPTEALTMAKVLRGVVPPPSTLALGLDPRFDAVCAKALARSPQARFATAREMALELEAIAALPMSAIASYVERTCGDELRAHSERLRASELGPGEMSGVSTVRDPPLIATAPGGRASSGNVLVAPTLRSPDASKKKRALGGLALALGALSLAAASVTAWAVKHKSTTTPDAGSRAIAARRIWSGQADAVPGAFVGDATEDFVGAMLVADSPVSTTFSAVVTMVDGATLESVWSTQPIEDAMWAAFGANAGRVVATTHPHEVTVYVAATGAITHVVDTAFAVKQLCASPDDPHGLWMELAGKREAAIDLETGALRPTTAPPRGCFYRDPAGKAGAEAVLFAHAQAQHAFRPIDGPAYKGLLLEGDVAVHGAKQPSGDDLVVAYDSRTWKQLWSRTDPPSTSVPHVLDLIGGRVYIQSSTSLECTDARTGKLIWKAVPGQKLGAMTSGMTHLRAGPQRVYLSTLARLIVLDAATGREVGMFPKPF